MKKKIVLAYSGGLDTTVIVPWLKENYDCDVIAVCGDVGQECDWVGLEKRAIASGATKLIVQDLKDEFVSDYLWPLIKSGTPYERRYLLGTSAARPLIAKGLAQLLSPKEPTRWRTDAPERATTRCVSNSGSRLSLPRWPS